MFEYGKMQTVSAKEENKVRCIHCGKEIFPIDIRHCDAIYVGKVEGVENYACIDCIHNLDCIHNAAES